MKLFSTIIKISGAAIVFYSIAGFIAGLFDYVLVLKGSEMPMVDGGMAIVLIIVGAALFALGHFMLKRAEKKDPETGFAPQLDINDLQFITAAIKRTRRRNLLIGIPLILFGGLMAIVPFADPEAEPTSGVGIGVFAIVALMVFLGVFMIIKAIKMSNVQDTPIYQTMIREPKTITALHAQIIHNRYTKHGQQINATINIGTKKLAVLSVSADELSLLHQYLEKHNPALVYNETVQTA